MNQNRKNKVKPLEEMNVMDNFMMNELVTHPELGERSLLRQKG